MPPVVPPWQTVEAVTAAINVATITGVSVSLAASVLGGVFGSAAGGASFSAGGGITPLVLGVQRFSTSSGLGVPLGELQAGAAGGLRWISGEVSFLPPPPPPLPPPSAEVLTTGSQRQLRHHVLALGMPPELISLLNTLLTAAIAIALTVLLQWVLVLLWLHAINRRFYRMIRSTTPDATPTIVLAEPRKSRFAYCGRRCMRRKPPKFFPFPKSLV